MVAFLVCGAARPGAPGDALHRGYTARYRFGASNARSEVPES